MSQQKKFVHIIGIRPHIPKFSPITDKDIIIWTGQHYDKVMFDNIWKEFGLKKPKYILKGLNDKRVMKILGKIRPDCVVVYGDCATTMLGAISATRLKIPLAHIEAGLRSNYNRPEEMIRRTVDGMADYLFCPNYKAAKNCLLDGCLGKIFTVGDPMYDEYIKNRDHKGWVLATFHRQEHVDTKEGLETIMKMLEDEKCQVIFPVHPRTKKSIAKHKVQIPKNVEIVQPFGYKQLNSMFHYAKKVITDSGGVTKEAFFNGCPVKTYEIDEWPEVMAFGDGSAKEKIKEILLREFE